MARGCRFSICLSLLFLTAASPAQAASLLEQVPQDSLGFVLVRNLSQADAKIAKAMNALRLPLPAPLAMIKSMGGISAGLDPGRDLLVAVLPPENNMRSFHLAVWLPVKDYDTLVRSLDGDPQRRIAPATIAGEDVLIAHIADCAVIVDPDQRERLTHLADIPESVTQPKLDAGSLIDRDSDLSLVVFAAGMQTAGSWIAAEGASAPLASDAAAVDQTRRGQIVPVQPQPRNDNSWGAVWKTVVAMLADAQELKRMAMEAKGFGCSLRLDATGNAIVKLRVALNEDVERGGSGRTGLQRPPSAPRLYDGGPFVINSSGRISGRWLLPLVAPYMRQTVADLKTEFNAKIDPSDVIRLQSTVEQAVVQVRAASILTRPGGEQDGVYTNSFLAVSVGSADEFIKQSTTAIDQINVILGKTEAGGALALETTAINIDGYPATQYSVDIIQAFGAPPLPELKKSMEKLYGPGGQLRLQIVKIDAATVLMSRATEDQLAAAIRVIKANASDAVVDNDKSQSVASFLTAESDWRFYFGLDGYNRWLTRQMEAIVGPVIGGPIIRPFPESPPIGVAGGMAQDVVWAEMAVPADTLRAIGQFLHP